MKNIKEQLEIIKRGVVDLISEEELIAKLKKGKPLTVKLGIDPTSSDITLGNTVPLRKLRQFQDLGHEVIIIIGNYTAMVGDPSGKNATRPQLSYDDVMGHAKYYQGQILRILDKDKTKFVYNGDWFSKFSFIDVIKLASKITVASLLEHDYFLERYKKGTPISLHEFIYPLMQGWDSVEIKADIELGGTDQRFNIIVGRGLMKENGQEPQVGMFLPILTGTDGVNKMSKSMGNYVSINDTSKDMFGKLMSIPDSLMECYFELLTDIPAKELKEIQAKLKDGSLHPREVKQRLAKEITGIYYGSETAVKEADAFDKVFRDKQAPENIEEFKIDAKELKDGKLWIVKLLMLAKVVANKSEATRLIKQGGVTYDNVKIEGPEKDVEIKKGAILKAGKRKFVKTV